ncbi:F-box domain-containing protein [Favolaschia claudopus]|uniref:F-box domain-containing protein n=1 Tax=Favolaschia claudopus TaxID=2862362 RepID=A0AAW0C9U8_9AGAR
MLLDDDLPFPFSRLPFDVTELILSRVDSRRDLISFAATSSECKELVVPRHSEYRELRVRDKPEVWAHLCQRPDLAKNVRRVTIQGPTTKSKPERYPTTLLDSTVLPEVDTAQTIASICQALGNMEYLRSFTWIAACTPTDPYVESRHLYRDIFSALKTSKSLCEFKMVDTMPSPGVSVEEENYPLWHIANLQSLFLGHSGWWRQGLESLLTRSPNLQALDISLSLELGAEVLASCCFPQLRQLNLNTTSSNSTADIVKFLQNHPTIQSLRWYPNAGLANSVVGHGSLPNLKCLHSHHSVASSILADLTVPNRTIECVSQLSLDEPTLAILDAIDTSHLRDIRIWRYSGLESVGRFAESFPSLTRLEIPKFGIPTRDDAQNDYTIDDYILTLSKFRNLEYLVDSALWPLLLLEDSPNKINSLVCQCPNLQRLGYFDTNKLEYLDIVFHRDEHGGQASWSEEAAETEWYEA